MKIYISVDIEGCTGIVSFSQCGSSSRDHYDYPFAREMMTADMSAVIDGAIDAGASSIVIKDGHGTCKNLLVDQLRDGVSLISGYGGTTDGMMDGIDASFDAAMLCGYHAMAGGEPGFMEHALVGGLKRFWINRQLAGEILTNAAVAGAYRVPTVLVTTDFAGAQEAGRCLPGVETVVTKRALGQLVGKLDSPSKTLPLIREAARRAASDAAAKRPFTILGEVQMKAEFRTAEEADLGSILPGVNREDAYSLTWLSEDFLTAHRIALDVFWLSMRGRSAFV